MEWGHSHPVGLHDNSIQGLSGNLWLLFTKPENKIQPVSQESNVKMSRGKSPVFYGLAWGDPVHGPYLTHFPISVDWAPFPVALT